MASSDIEQDLSDDDVVVSGSRRRTGQGLASRPKGGQARWEASATRNYALQEGEDGSIAGVLGGIEEASKRRR